MEFLISFYVSDILLNTLNNVMAKWLALGFTILS